MAIGANLPTTRNLTICQTSPWAPPRDPARSEAFLTTQQVDEARHAQHFNYEQVVEILGYSSDETQGFALQALSRRLRVTGGDLQAVAA